MTAKLSKVMRDIIIDPVLMDGLVASLNCSGYDFGRTGETAREPVMRLRLTALEGSGETPSEVAPDD